MSEEIYKEKALTLPQAAAVLPRRKGKRVHVATIYRWIAAGVKGVRLESRKIGGKRYTSRGALTRFSKQLTRLDETSDAPLSANPNRSTRDRARGNARAKKALHEMKATYEPTGDAGQSKACNASPGTKANESQSRS